MSRFCALPSRDPRGHRITPGITSLFSILLVLVGGAGCAVVTPADPNRLKEAEGAATFVADTWPQRYPELLKEQLHRKDAADADAIVRLGESAQGVPINSEAFRLLGLMVPVDELPPTQVVGQSLVVETEPGSKFMVVLNRFDEEHFPELIESGDPVLWQNSNLPRWRFSFERPEDDPGTSPRGLVIHLVSIGDRSYESRVTATLRSRGWATLEALPSPLVIRFQQLNDDRGTSLVAAERISRTLDAFGADYAHAVHDMVAYLRDRHPELRQVPVVIIGYSAGALATPTVAARLLPDLQAVVLIGGGVNVAGIMLDSTVANIGSRLRREGGAAVSAELDSFTEQYLASSRFDPYHTAPMLRAVPTLMVHGSLDRIVPASYGNQLYERLGRPERWSYPLGHALLFWWLPTQATRIADWIEHEAP